MPFPHISAEQIGRLIRLSQIPDNVRFSRWLEESIFSLICPRFLLWRLARWVFGSSLFDSKGKFIYQRSGEEIEITFNGRNAQFESLYGKHYANGYELETSVLLSRLACGKDAFYDIGANWGYFSLLIAGLPFFKGHIYAFEPNPRSFLDLKSTVGQAGLDDSTTAMNIGLGSEDGELNLVEEDKFKTGHARLVIDGKGQRVPVRKLDSLNILPPMLIKLDAEFMEKDIIIGGHNLIQKYRPYIIFENFLSFEKPSETYDTLELLKAWDYRLFNPCLLYTYDGTSVLASYGDNFSTLMKKCANPECVLNEVTAKNRFLLHGQLNIFACPKERLREIADKGCVLLTLDKDS